MSGIQMALLGASGFLDRQTITTGGDGDPIDVNQRRGWYQGSFGTIVDGTSNIYSGATIYELAWREDPGVYIFGLDGSNANSGWTTLTIVGNGTKVLTRTSGTYYNGGVSTSWTWSTTDSVSAQAFGAISSTAVCTFT
jgi:hypothetical protein